MNWVSLSEYSSSFKLKNYMIIFINRPRVMLSEIIMQL